MADTLFPDESHYPHVPGVKSGDDTARSAAEAAGQVNSERKKQVLAAVREKPGAMYEIAARLNKSTYAVAPVLSQLRKLGLIEDSKRRFINPSGSKAIVWQAIPTSQVKVA